jgi:VWFA-related protein
MRLIAVSIASLLAAIAVFPQDDNLRVETNLVTLNVSVVDRSGRAVTGLKKDDFIVLDIGVRQIIDSFSLHDAPISVGVIYDIHEANQEHTRNILAALRAFSSSLGNEDDIFINVIGERGSLTTEFVPTEEQIRDNLVNTEKNFKNSLYDAIFEASRKLSGARNSKRFLILLTDGADRSSHHKLKDLKSHLRTINLPLYSVTFGGNDRTQFGYSDVLQPVSLQRVRAGEASELDRAVVTELSRSSGGQSFEGEVRNRVYLTAIFAKVFSEVRDQYVLGFYPDKLDGKYHKIKVSIEGQKERGIKLSSRSGYRSRRSAQDRKE